MDNLLGEKSAGINQEMNLSGKHRIVDWLKAE